MNWVRGALGALAWTGGLLLTVPVLIAGLPFWIVSGLTRAARASIEWLRPLAVPWQELIRYEPTVGWRPKPNLRVHARGSGLFRLSTDDDGWRGRRTIEEADLVVFGDSFAFGHAADDRIFFADIHPSLKIKAIGSNGYSMVHGLLWMERLAHRLAGKVVVWLIYYGNDLLENLQPNLGRYRMPFVRESERPDGWEVVTGHVSAEPWPFIAPRDYTRLLAEICTPGFLSMRTFAACGFLIRRARDLCHEVGAELVVMGNPDVDLTDPERQERLRRRAPWPEAFDPRRPDHELAASCQEIGVPFIALADHLSVADHLPDDCHWNAAGHRRVAELLGQIYAAVRSSSGNGRAGMDEVARAAREMSAP